MLICTYLILVFGLGCNTWAARPTATTFATNDITEDKFKETLIPVFDNETIVFDLLWSENDTNETDSTRAPKSAETESDLTDLDSKDELLLAFHKHIQRFGEKRETTAPAVIRNCGKRITSRHGRVVGGRDAYEGEFPWVVSVRLLTIHVCGGTIINKQWILTAAHCMKRYTARYFRIRIGEKDVAARGFRYDDIHVSEISIHPDFGKPRRYSNDLALLKLKRPLTYSNIAQPICLPDIERDYSGRNATAVGWGAMKEDAEELAHKLQKVSVPIVNNTVCGKWYSAVHNGIVKIYDYHICAGFTEGGKDACQGDSGGPLLTKEGDSYVLIGAVSVGAGCGRKQLPGIYSRISLFVPWIRNITSSTSA